MSMTTWSAVTDAEAESPVRLSISAPTAPVETSNRVFSGVLSSQAGQQVQQRGDTIRLGEDALSPNTATIIGTARNNAGMPTGNITPETTVEVPGVGRMAVKVAERLGYLERKGEGVYAETFQEDFMEKGPAQPQGPDMETFGPRAEGAYNEMIADIAQPVYDSIMGSAAAMIGAGSSLEDVTGKLAERLVRDSGIDPSRADQMTKVGAEVWQGQADRRITALGADPAEFYQWAQENHRNDLQQAVIQHLYGRNTKGYADLVARYFDSTVPTLAAIQKAGLPTKVQGGQDMVKLKGQWMTVKSAAKAKLL